MRYAYALLQNEGSPTTRHAQFGDPRCPVSGSRPDDKNKILIRVVALADSSAVISDHDSYLFIFGLATFWRKFWNHNGVIIVVQPFIIEGVVLNGLKG